MSTRFAIRLGSSSPRFPVLSSAVMLACVCLLWPGVGPVCALDVAKPAVPAARATPTPPTPRATPAAERRFVPTRQKLDRQFMNTAIQKAAYTGNRGDGKICVTDVGRAIRISTEENGEAALNRCVDHS